MPRNLFLKALKMALVFFLAVFCTALIVLALLTIYDLVRTSPPPVKILVWSLTGLGLFILAAAGLYLKGRSDASAEMMGRVQELKEHILELQRFNLEMEKRLAGMDVAFPPSAAFPAPHASASLQPISGAAAKSEKAGRGEKKFQWLRPWNFSKAGSHE